MFLYMSCYRVEVSGSNVARQLAPALIRLTRCIHCQLHILLGAWVGGHKMINHRLIRIPLVLKAIDNILVASHLLGLGLP